MDSAKIENKSVRSLSEITPIKSVINDDVIPIDDSTYSSSSSNSFIKSESLSSFDASSSLTHFTLADPAIYDGSIPDEDDVDFKLLFDSKKDEAQNDVEIDVRGVKYKIPFAIECHLCNEMMNLCLRRTRYRGQSREYPAYRCNRKGCQTFRSIRKVFSNCVNEKAEETPQTMIYQPPLDKITPKFQTNLRGEFSEDELDDFVIQRVNMPKPDKRNGDSLRSLSVTDRVRRANQERAVVFSEFADQLRRDIAANKRIRVRKQLNEEDEQQGTLFYISKELNPHEIIELQDAIIKTLISLRKIPPPMTMLDLPLFANCPYSKSNLEAGLESSKYREDFWAAFTSSPQPPLPPGFTRRKDDTLIYRDPKPYDVPEILQQNSPRKQAEAIINYNQRKGEQDAKRMEKRFTEKKYRSWASLKREFDMAERDGTTSPKMLRAMSSDGRGERKSRKVTLQELIDKMEGGSNGRMTGKIKPGSSERGSETMQWIDAERESDTQETEESRKKSGVHEESFEDSEKRLKPISVHQMMRSMTTPMKTPISPMARSFSTMENIDMKHSLPSPIFFGDVQFNNSQFYTLNPYFSSYQHLDSWNQSQRDLSNDQQYQCGGPSDEGSSDAPYTFVHPDSGARLTDPSAYLNSFVPSPVTKMAPMSFPEESGRPRRNSEPSTSSMYYEENNNRIEEKIDMRGEENKKIIDNFLKFDPPLIGE